MIRLISLLLAFSACFAPPRSVKTDCVLEKQYQCFFNRSEVIWVGESIKNSRGRILSHKSPSGLEYKRTYKDTMEWDSSSKQLLGVMYETQIGNHKPYKTTHKRVYNSRNHLLWLQDEEGIRSYQYVRKYSKDSVVLEETELWKGSKQYTHQFRYDKQGRLIAKDWIYYNCCTGHQPIYDREEYWYDTSGKCIQKCKIADASIPKSYKKELYNQCDCHFYKYHRDTLVEDIPFSNENALHPTIKTAMPTYYYKYVHEIVNCDCD